MEMQYNKLAKLLIRRNLIEVSVTLSFILATIFYRVETSLSLYPLLIVLMVFIFDFYIIFKFNKTKDVIGLSKFESRNLFYSFAWYFLPILVSAMLFFKKIGSFSHFQGIVLIISSIGLYLLNLKASKNLLKEFIEVT